MFTVYSLWAYIYMCMHVLPVHIPVGMRTHTRGYTDTCIHVCEVRSQCQVSSITLLIIVLETETAIRPGAP